jgi:hypothetical protein
MGLHIRITNLLVWVRQNLAIIAILKCNVAIFAKGGCLVRAQLPNLLPGVAPPWNRMSDATLAELPGLGYRFISAFEGPTSNLPIDGLLRVNAHVDPIRWRHGKMFRGTETTLELITNHLALRREGSVDFAEPTGILTHHLETGADIWNFMDQLFDRLSFQGIAKWISLASLLATR